MHYEMIDSGNAVLFSDKIDDVIKAAKKVADELGLYCYKITQDFIPVLQFKNRSGNICSQFLIIKVGEEEYFEEQPNPVPIDTTEKPVPQEVNKELLQQYQTGVRYTRQAIADIIQEFDNEIVLRELLINTFEAGESTLDLGSNVIKPLIQKAQKGKVQKPFTPYGKGSKKHVKDFMRGNQQPGDENPLLEESMESVDKFFSKMQRGLSKKDRGGIGIQTEEEAQQVREDIAIFEKGKSLLIGLKNILRNYSPAAFKNLFGENGEAYQNFLDKLFSVANNTYLLFVEEKYEYRDDMGTYLQVTSEKARQYVEEYRALITYFESVLQQ